MYKRIGRFNKQRPTSSDETYPATDHQAQQELEELRTTPDDSSATRPVSDQATNILAARKSSLSKVNEPHTRSSNQGATARTNTTSNSRGQ